MRELLDEPVEDDPIYHIAEVAAAAQREFEAKGGVSMAPTDFAANHDKYVHADILTVDRNIPNENTSVQANPLCGTVARYDDPFGPAVPIEDWEALQ